MDILRELRESGLKVTIPRLRILQLFQEGTIKHLSADDVYKLLLAEKIDVGLATIYRVLMQFAEAGILFRRHFESGHAVFELNEGQHVTGMLERDVAAHRTAHHAQPDESDHGGLVAVDCHDLSPHSRKSNIQNPEPFAPPAAFERARSRRVQPSRLRPAAMAASVCSYGTAKRAFWTP